MSVIEQAARRLEQFATSGHSLPWAPFRLPDDMVDAVAVEPHPMSRRTDSGAETPNTRQGPLVTLDLERIQSSGYLVPSLDGSRLADEMRRLKRTLIARVGEASTDRSRRNALIMVTSALPNEGKTYCSINLAMSIAMEVDNSVLLVDADVLKPALPERLGIAPARGLLDVLAEPSLDLSRVILRTNVPKLSILPTGTLSSRASELLGSATMNRLLAELAGRYSDRIVIFDAPPLLIAPSAQMLAGRMGQVVMVVEASRTPRRAVAEAFASVAHCPYVVSLLNKCDAGVEVSRAGYYGELQQRQGTSTRLK